MKVTGPRWLLWTCLLATYLIWGSTYLGIAYALDTLPPFLMAGIRFTIAGGFLWTFLRWRGYSSPTPKEWLGAATASLGMLLVGNGLVVYAEQTLPSSVVALTVTISPLVTASLGHWIGKPTHQQEWLGLSVGLLAIGVLYYQDLTTLFQPAVWASLLAAVGWAVGVILGQKLPQPRGMMASAAQMWCGGLALLMVATLHGETITTWPSSRSIWALLYLTVFGSLVAFTAYNYLLKHTSLALATSSAYVNPVIAVILGVSLNQEPLHWQMIAATALVVISLVILKRPLPSQDPST